MTADTKPLPYLPYPRFLLGADLTQTAKVLYAVLLDRANLSRANGWTDEDGNIFVVFPLNKLADMVDKGPTTVKTALTELEAAGLIERRRCGNGMPNRIYVKQPDSQDIDRLMDRKPATRQPENRPSDSRKTDRQMAGKLAPNKISNSNLKNNLSGVSESARIFGRYGNVFLTEAEIAELQADFPTVWQEYIERLSEYMTSTGKTYKSHAATIRRWAKEDRRKGKGFTDPAMREWTFANDNGKCPQMKHARFYVEHWDTMQEENIGYLLWGGVGTGKSYFAGCIANALMEQEVAVRMTNFALILNDLTASFEGRNEYISRLCRAPLLILDDFGMERGTEYGLEQVYNVIDSRYRSRRPLIVTTNLSLQDLQHPQDTAHARIYDRLLEMCAPIRFSGENFRKVTAQDKLARLKNLMEPSALSPAADD